MPEQQNIEYKSSWHDDYLKWIAGFANANGGIIYIGIDDDGVVTGVTDYVELMDGIPNKVRNLLGIMVDVNLHEEKGLKYIEIVTPAYTVPISLRGRYYYRSGSTKQEFTGNALSEFLLRKTGKTWDDVIEPNATIHDIDADSIKEYLYSANKSGRLPDLTELSISELLIKLRLSDNGNIKRAAIILFGKDPGRFYPNIVAKTGRFGTNDYEIKYQETVEGNLIHLLKEVPDQLNKKFFIKPITFEGLLRIEKGEYPVPALREMLLNALIHRIYMGSMIQIRVYDNHFSIWNDGALPEGITIESLKHFHISKPRNPIIADVCFKGGYIDSWGSGTLKIINSCRDAGLPEPEIKELNGGMLVTLFKDVFNKEHLVNLGLNERQLKAVNYLLESGRITNSIYQDICNTSERTASRDLENLVSLKILKTTGEKKGTYYELIGGYGG